jgi:hypothetical protein
VPRKRLIVAAVLVAVLALAACGNGDHKCPAAGSSRRWTTGSDRVLLHDHDVDPQRSGHAFVDAVRLGSGVGHDGAGVGYCHRHGHAEHLRPLRFTPMASPACPFSQTSSCVPAAVPAGDGLEQASSAEITARISVSRLTALLGVATDPQRSRGESRAGAAPARERLSTPTDTCGTTPATAQEPPSGPYFQPARTLLADPLRTKPRCCPSR